MLYAVYLKIAKLTDMSLQHKKSQHTKLDLEALATDPFRFEELVETWNAVFDREALDRVSNASEAAFDAALVAITQNEDSDIIGARLRHLINGLPHATLVVRQDGVLQAMNRVAMGRMTCDPGDHVDALGLALEGSERLQAVVARLLDRRNDPAGEVGLYRAVEDATARTLTLAVVPSPRGEGEMGQALLFLIDPVWRQETEAIMARAFNLTEAECGVLFAFLDGQTLKDIALSRGRSLATIRTQFQKIMEKTGAHGQADLMRNTLAVSQFFQDVQDVSEVASHPRRKRFDMLRPGGRSIDVTLAGKMDGALVVFIADTTQWTFHAHIEEAFHNAGLCVASLCRPGYGRTDPPPRGEEYDPCLADDIKALMVQTGTERCVIWGHNTSTPFAVRSGMLLEDQVSCVFLHSAVTPAPFFDADQVGTPWVSAVMRALRGSPTMYRLMVRAGIKAWQAMGTRRIYAMQLRGNDSDVALATTPESVAEFDASIKQVMAQGLDYSIMAFDYAAKDWSDWVTACRAPVHLMQGTQDGTSPIGAARAMAAAFPGKVTLQELEGAGFMALLSHTDVFVAALQEAVHGASEDLALQN